MFRRIAKEGTELEPDLLHPWPDQSVWCEMDINLAAQCDGPVLITATPDDALAIARLIATLARGECPTQVLTCDPAEGGDVLTEMADSALHHQPGSDRPILLLREVQMLTSSEQAAVMNRLGARASWPVEHLARILASSSIDLFEAVRRGAFDERLFYCLNQIHIVRSSRSRLLDAG